MSALTKTQPTIVRTERGLSIAGTRITLYQIMDYVTAGWTAKLIGDRLQLTDQQIADVMKYLETHRAEVENEYQRVLKSAEENRRYWEKRNKKRLARIESSPPKPEQEQARAKLQSWKARLGV
jgi:uncharacterized protein (DUF433 family)